MFNQTAGEIELEDDDLNRIDDLAMRRVSLVLRHTASSTLRSYACRAP